MSIDDDAIINYIMLSARKRSSEKTPGGRPRYYFHFGWHDPHERFVMHMFKTFKPINALPLCTVSSANLTDFIEACKRMGLRFTKAEREKLYQDQRASYG